MERRFYQEQYGAHVEAQNARNEKNRHTERNRSTGDLLKNNKTCPEETIYQIGTMEESASPEILLQIATEFFAEFDRRFGERIHILNWALHLDEATPHIHERHVFDCENKYGEIAPQQEKALEALGFDLPDPGKPKGKHNNRKQTFDAACREILFSIAQNHGLQLEHEPEYGGRDYLEKQDFILMKQKEQMTRQEEKLEELTLKIEDVETLLDDVAEAAYDKAVEVVTDVVQAETRKADIAILDEYQERINRSKNSPQTLKIANRILNKAKEKLTELYDMTFLPRIPVIEGLLCSGTYLFAGSPKIGKSFLMAQLGYHVATGTPLWEYSVRQGEVLYLALEDDYSRLQGRLNQMFGVETVDGLHLATQARTLAEGLNTQLEEFVQLHPNTRLIIVDTLQKVRETGNESYSYSMDYQNITNLKAFSDAHNLAILVVHHTRKMEASDSFDMISGTNGLLGAADGAFVLQKKKRTDPAATLQVVGRDQPDQELMLEFSQKCCVWQLTKAARPLMSREPEEIIRKVAAFMTDRVVWTGTASELLEAMHETQILPHNLTRKLNVNVSVLLNEFGIL